MVPAGEIPHRERPATRGVHAAAAHPGGGAAPRHPTGAPRDDTPIIGLVADKRTDLDETRDVHTESRVISTVTDYSMLSIFNRKLQLAGWEGGYSQPAASISPHVRIQGAFVYIIRPDPAPVLELFLLFP